MILMMNDAQLMACSRVFSSVRALMSGLFVRLVTRGRADDILMMR